MKSVLLRGLNIAGIKFRGLLLHPRNFDTFAGIADGQFRNLLRISRMGRVQIFSQISPIDKAVLVHVNSKTMKTKVQTPEEETEGYMNHVFSGRKKAETKRRHHLYRIKTV